MPKAARLRFVDAVLIGSMLTGGVFFQIQSLHKTAVAGESVAVIFAPWVAAPLAFEKVAAADARIVRTGAVPFIVIAQAQHQEFGQRIRALGAWLTLDPIAVAACFNYFGDGK
jgi:hypothetical protein